MDILTGDMTVGQALGHLEAFEQPHVPNPGMDVLNVAIVEVELPQPHEGSDGGGEGLEWVEAHIERHEGGE